jgi:hypothetical protein
LNGLPGVIGIDPQYQPAAPDVRNGTPPSGSPGAPRRSAYQKATCIKAHTTEVFG